MDLFFPVGLNREMLNRNVHKYSLTDRYRNIKKSFGAHLHPATVTPLQHHCDVAPNGLQSNSPVTAKLVAVTVVNAQCNSTTPKQ